VLDQSYSANEIIVVDDGSTDHTVTRIRKEFPEVKIITQPNQGVSSARNAGIRAAKGHWIAFLDSDDEWDKGKLAAQVGALDQSPQFEICHTDEIWIRDGRRVNQMRKHAKPDGWIFEHCLPLCCVSPSAVLVTKPVLESVGLFDESLPVCEDYDLWLKIFSRIPVLLVADKLLIKYGGHDDQLSRKYWGMDRFRVSALVSLLENNDLNESYRRLALEKLCEKLSILINGFEKRGNSEQVNYYQDILNHWSSDRC
jgi:GT2 family glycosyltransferase